MSSTFLVSLSNIGRWGQALRLGADRLIIKGYGTPDCSAREINGIQRTVPMTMSDATLSVISILLPWHRHTAMIIFWATCNPDQARRSNLKAPICFLASWNTPLHSSISCCFSFAWQQDLATLTSSFPCSLLLIILLLVQTYAQSRNESQIYLRRNSNEVLNRHGYTELVSQSSLACGENSRLYEW